MTFIRVRRNGWEFVLRTAKPWEEVITICAQRFTDGRDIGGPELPVTEE